MEHNQPPTLLRNQLLGQNASKKLPVWLMRQAGRYLPEYRAIRKNHEDFLGFCFSPEDAAEVTMQPIRRYDMDAAIIFSDILVVPHAMGQRVWFEKGEGPRLEVLENADHLSRLRFEPKKLEKVMEAIQRTRSMLPAEKSLIGFAGAPWTLACYMLEGKTARDYAKARMRAMTEPAMMAELIQKLVDAVVEHLIHQVHAGADVLMLFDSWAGVLDADGFQQWCVEPAKAIRQKLLQACPHVPVIGFPRGAGAGYWRYASVTGVDAMAVDSSLTPEDILDLQQHVVVQGNVDNLRLAHDPSTMMQQLERLLQVADPKKLVINLGHGVIPETNPDHVARLVARVKEFR